MRRFLPLALLLPFIVSPLRAGPVDGGFEPELRVYPAGVVPSLLFRVERFHLGVGWNFTDRRDFGEHRNEEGDGFGVNAGFRHPFRGERDHPWFWGVRADVWKLDIDWRDPGRSGSSEILVLQPTAEVGRRWESRQKRLQLSVFAALGAEVNIDTIGEQVGEGAILLLGVSLGRGPR